MSAHQAEFRITSMCRVFGVSTRGYYAWRSRAPSAREQKDATLLVEIERIHHQSRQTCGSQRIHAELREDGTRIGRKRVARLMKQARIAGVTRCKHVRTTRRDTRDRPAPDLVNRAFAATGPDQLWVADITYIPTLVGLLYLAVVLDVWSRKPYYHRCRARSLRLHRGLLQHHTPALLHRQPRPCDFRSSCFANHPCCSEGRHPLLGPPPQGGGSSPPRSRCGFASHTLPRSNIIEARVDTVPRRRPNANLCTKPGQPQRAATRRE